MPPRHSRNNDLRAIEAIARIHDKAAGRAPRGAGPERPAPPPQKTWEPPDPQPLPPQAFGPLPNLERPRPGRRVLVAALLVAGIGVVGLGIAGAVGSNGNKSHKSSGSSAGHSALAAGHGSGRVRGSSSSSEGSGGSRSSGSRGHTAAGGGKRSARSGGSGRSSSSTAKTGSGPLQPTSTAAGTANYVISGSKQVTVTISVVNDPCWAEAAQQAGGTITWAGTVQPGSDQVLTAGPSWWIRLGAPGNATVTANGRTLALPGTGDAPVDLDITTS